MRSGDNLIKTFARCFRLLAKLNAGIKDGFFVGLISRESENLLSEYLEFLKIRGDIIAQSSTKVRPWKSKVGPWYCGDILQTRVDTILKLLEIIKHTNQIAEITTPLLLERELLKLKLSLLDHNEMVQTANIADIKVNSGPVINKNKKPKKLVKPQDFGEVHKRIAEFVKSKERVQNVEVFSQFADTTRRTLKRKLSELVKAGAIKRLALGKKVFYATPNLSENLSELNSDRLSTG